MDSIWQNTQRFRYTLSHFKTPGSGGGYTIKTNNILSRREAGLACRTVCIFSITNRDSILRSSESPLSNPLPPLTDWPGSRPEHRAISRYEPAGRRLEGSLKALPSCHGLLSSCAETKQGGMRGDIHRSNVTAFKLATGVNKRDYNYKCKLKRPLVRLPAFGKGFSRLMVAVDELYLLVGKSGSKCTHVHM